MSNVLDAKDMPDKQKYCHRLVGSREGDIADIDKDAFKLVFARISRESVYEKIHPWIHHKLLEVPTRYRLGCLLPRYSRREIVSGRG